MDTDNESSLYGIATLNKFGLPYGIPLANVDELPAECHKCSAKLFRPDRKAPAWIRLWTWQITHVARCGGKGAAPLIAHTQMKVAMRRHVFLGDVPAGAIYKNKSVVKYEERNLRPNDSTAPGDLTAPDPADPFARKLVMDTVCYSCLKESALDDSSCPREFVLHQAEGRANSLTIKINRTQAYTLTR